MNITMNLKVIILCWLFFENDSKRFLTTSFELAEKTGHPQTKNEESQPGPTTTDINHTATLFILFTSPKRGGILQSSVFWTEKFEGIESNMQGHEYDSLKLLIENEITRCQGKTIVTKAERSNRPRSLNNCYWVRYGMR